MMKLSLALAVTGLTLVACDKKSDPPPTTTSAPVAAPVAPPPVAAAATPAAKPAAAKLDLEESKNEKMHYTIKLPKGSTTTMADQNGGMYTRDTMIINVGPSGVALKTVDDVLRGVNTGTGNVEKKTEGDVLLAIVTADKSPVNVYAGPKGSKVVSHCMAEPSDKDLAIEICSSLRAVKK